MAEQHLEACREVEIQKDICSHGIVAYFGEREEIRKIDTMDVYQCALCERTYDWIKENPDPVGEDEKYDDINYDFPFSISYILDFSNHPEKNIYRGNKRIIIMRIQELLEREYHNFGMTFGELISKLSEEIYGPNGQKVLRKNPKQN